MCASFCRYSPVEGGFLHSQIDEELASNSKIWVFSFALDSYCAKEASSKDKFQSSFIRSQALEILLRHRLGASRVSERGGNPALAINGIRKLKKFEEVYMSTCKSHFSIQTTRFLLKLLATAQSPVYNNHAMSQISDPATEMYSFWDNEYNAEDSTFYSVPWGKNNFYSRQSASCLFITKKLSRCRCRGKVSVI